MATGTYAPDPVFTGFDNNGAIVPSAKLFTYAAGTSTKLATYTNVGLTSANTNPIVLDSAGRATIFLGPYSYKFVLAPSTDTDPPASPYWTRDNVASVPNTNVDLDITGTAGEALTANDFVYCSDGSGGATAGRWYKTDADNTYSSTLAKSIGVAVADIASAASGSIRIQGRVTGLTGLTAGTAYYLSATAGAITSVAPTNSRLVCEADSTTSVILSYWVALVDASATAGGLVSLGDQTLGTGIKTFGAAMTYKPGTSSTAAATVSGRIHTDVTTTNGATGGGTDVGSLTIKANTLLAAGKVLRITFWGRFAANAANKTLYYYLDGTQVFASMTQALNDYIWKYVVDIFRTGAATETAFMNLTMCPNAATSAGAVYAEYATLTKDLATDLVSKMTIVSGTASGDVIYDGCYYEVVG